VKKILIVFDEPGWCFFFHAREIQKRLANDFIIDIIDHRKNIPELSKQYNLVYVLDPMPLSFGYPPANKTIMGLRNQFLYEEHPQGARGLYEHGFPGRCVSIKDKCCILHMVNKNQMKAFKDIVIDKPLLLAQHGVDENIFDKNKYVKVKEDYLRVSVSGRNSDNKGFDIVKEACQKTGSKFVVAQYGRHKLSKEQMPLFYNGVDVHICFSKSEGLNNPILESGAMGVPVIATRTGAVEEMIKDGENGLLIDRNMDSLVGALNRMKDRDFRENMGNKFYEEIMKSWTWKTKIEDFRRMFGRYFEKREIK